MIYRPNDDEAAVALLIAKRRNSLNGGGSNLPQEKATPEERLLQHYRGALAEISVARLFNLCWTGCGKGATGLHDVGGWLEVRSIKDPTRCLLAHFADRNTDPAVLVYVEDSTRKCALLGWTYFGVVKREGEELAPGTDKRCWILPQSKLLPISELTPVRTATGLRST